jgi:hypothetical protein
VVVPRLCENYVSPRGPGKKPWGENKMAAFFFSELRIIRVFFFRRKKKVRMKTIWKNGTQYFD